MARPLDLRSSLALLALLALAAPATAQTGRVTAEVELAPGLLGFDGQQAATRHVGSSVAALGDLDGDGIGELAVGDFDGGPGSKGVVWILFFDASGVVRDEVAIGEGLGGFGATLPASATFGYSVCALGDVDGDGVEDLGVGAPLALSFTQERGAFHVLFLRADGTVRDSQEIAPGVGGFGGTIGFLSRFGWGCAGLGDLDGDGTREVAVSAPWPDGTTKPTGELYVLSLSAAGTVVAETRITNGEGGLPRTLSDGDLFGLSLAALEDLDGDGTADLAVGVGRVGSQGSFGVLFLDPDGAAGAWREVDPGDGTLPAYSRLTVAFYDAVRALAAPGDVDGDGTEDLLVGAVDTLWTVLLRPDGSVRIAVPIRPGLGGFTGGGAATTLGFALSGLGDVDGDGRVEAVFGAPYDFASTGAASGVTWLVTLGADGGAIELDTPGGLDALGPPARVLVQNGSGVNPLALSATARPVLGTQIALVVDVAAMGGLGPAGVAVYEGALPGLPTAYGELLIDPTSVRVFLGAGSSTGTLSLPLSIPNDPTLLGQVLHGQALAQAQPRARLSNAFELGL